MGGLLYQTNIHYSLWKSITILFNDNNNNDNDNNNLMNMGRFVIPDKYSHENKIIHRGKVLQ